MIVTEVRVKLMDDNPVGNERLRAFCSIVFDDMFIVRDAKIVESVRGLLVCMPARKLTDRCPRCRAKNAVQNRYCGGCGGRLADGRSVLSADGREERYADVAHPTCAEARSMIETSVLAAYAEELERSKQPGYVPLYSSLDDEPAGGAAPAGAGTGSPLGVRLAGRRAV